MFVGLKQGEITIISAQSGTGKSVFNDPKVGDKIPTWFSGEPDGMSTVVAKEPYRGRYTNMFRWNLTVTAPRTKKGTLEMCV